MIDERDIHIGSHLRVWNKRVRVCDIIGDLIGYALSDGGYEQSLLDRFEPIPITKILLAELGFEERVVSMYNCEKDNEVFVTKLSDNRYRFEIWTDDCNHGNIIARYLHELEFFYYHVFKKELIEE